MKLRVFLSSPGDVADERGLARQVLARLPQEAQFRGRVLIEEVSWDNPAAPVPLAAQLTPQEAINQGSPKPADCDVVVVVLWARMGTPLPAEYVKQDGTRFESGTEWEYLNAIGEAERRGNGTPSCWCTGARSRCCSIPKARGLRRAESSQRRTRRPVLRWIPGAERLAPPELPRVRRARRLREPAGAAPARAPLAPARVGRHGAAGRRRRAGSRGYRAAPLWQESPYPGLRAFTSSEAAIFFGRGRETDDVVAALHAGTTPASWPSSAPRVREILAGGGRAAATARGGRRAGTVVDVDALHARLRRGRPVPGARRRARPRVPKPGWKPAELARRLENAGAETLAEVVDAGARGSPAIGRAGALHR